MLAKLTEFLGEDNYFAKILAFFESLQVRLLFLEFVIPAEAGIQGGDLGLLDSRFHGNDTLNA